MMFVGPGDDLFLGQIGDAGYASNGSPARQQSTERRAAGQTTRSLSHAGAMTPQVKPPAPWDFAQVAGLATGRGCACHASAQARICSSVSMRSPRGLYTPRRSVKSRARPQFSLEAAASVGERGMDSVPRLAGALGWAPSEGSARCRSAHERRRPRRGCRQRRAGPDRRGSSPPGAARPAGGPAMSRPAAPVRRGGGVVRCRSRCSADD